MSEPMPTIPTQSPFTYPNPSASPSFTQDDTSESFIPEPTQPMPTFTQPAFSQPNQSIFSQPAVHFQQTQPTQTNQTGQQYPNNVQSQQFQQIVQARNSPNRLGKRCERNTIVQPPVSLIHVVVQRRIGLLGWQLRLEEEGLHKGYDRFQKILSQLNQVQARPDNDDINLKFLRALPSSWFEKKAGRKMNYNNQQPARFDRRKVRCYKCLQLGHFARECNVKTVDDKARYSAFKVTEVKTDEPKALVSVDSMVNWSDHAAENKTGEVEKVYGMMAGLHADNGGAGVSDAAAEFAMIGISPKLGRCMRFPSITWNLYAHPYKSDIEETQGDNLQTYETYASCDSSLQDQDQRPHLLLISRLCQVCLKPSKSTLAVLVFSCWRIFCPCKSKASSVPADSRNSSASVTTGGSDPAASRNRPAVNSAGRPNPTGRVRQAAHRAAAQSNPAGWLKNHTCFCGDDGVTAVTTQQVTLRNKNHILGSMRMVDSHPHGFQHLMIHQGQAQVRTGLGQGSIVKFGGGMVEISRKGTIRTSKLDLKCLLCGLIIPRERDSLTPSCISDLQPKQNVFTLFRSKSIPWMKSTKMATEDETFYVLKEFITLIENQLNKKVKGIRCDNGTEFKNAKLIELCGEKGIKRDYSNPRTPQQNGVAERKNRTLIEAARTMLADSKLPTMFWTEAVSTACYVLNRVSITNPHNKTPYELISGKVPQISHLKPFGCQVTILNTSDYLGKFEGKADEGYLVGYASNSKAYRVYNLPNKRVEETLNLRFLEDKPNVQGIGHEWYFDLDYLTDSLGYTRFKTDTPAGTQETNINAGTQDHDSDSEVDEQVIVVPSFPSNSFAGPSSSNGPSVMERNADYAEELAKLQRQEYEAKDAAARYGYLFSQATAEILCQAEAEIRNQGVSAVRDPAGIDSAVRDPAGIDSADGVSAGSPSAGSDPAGGNPADSFQPAGSFEPADESNPAVSSSVSADFNPVYADESTLPPGQSLGSSANTTRFPLPSDVCMDQLSSGIFTSSSYDDDFSATLTNVAPVVDVNQVPTRRVNTIHPQSQILGDLASPVLTRSRAQKSKFGESAFIGYIQDQQRTNHTDQLHCLFACFLSQLEPTSIAKALEDPDWVAAMQEEMQQFINQKVWKLVPLPDGKNAIGTKWILKNKRDARGIVVRNKARLVAQGHRQEEGIDYDEVFAPVARIEAIRLFLAFASYMGFLVYQMDVKSAFLYGEIEEEVYVTQPKGFEDPYFPKHVYRVVKALYGLHQAPRAWYARLSAFLLQHNYRRGTIDKTLFIKKDSRDILLVQVYVDDIIFGSTNKAWCEEFEVLMKGEFEMSAMGEMNFFLVSACSRHQVTPLTSHLNAVKKIFKYLKGQPKLGLWYPKDSPFQLEAYSDSDYAGSHGDRKSTTGGCQFLGRRLISWQCKKQTIVATSSTEAEYVAAASCCAQVLWIQNQLLDYGFNFMNTKIFIDNQSTICIVKNPVFHQRTKHIEIRHHFIRDANEKNLIQVLKIHTNDNVADLLTKAFDGPRFEYLVVHIGMVVNTAARCTFFLLTGLVSAGRTMVLLVVILSAGRTMILLVVILSAGRLVSAGRTMILLVVILPAGCFVSAGSYGLCCWFRVHAGGHTSAGGFISADRVYVPAVCMVSAVG
ncbi:putative ribonuclease H-like domain-containing protein [Tanacetum coccineum]